MVTRPPKIAVGIDHTDESIGATMWAADRASRHGGHLVLVHSCISPTYVPTTDGEVAVLQDQGRNLMAAAVESVGRAHPALPLSTVLDTSLPIPLLEQISERVDAVVVGRRPRRRFDMRSSISISAEVSARSACALITVPGRPDGGRGPIVASVDLDSTRSEHVVSRAFAYAHQGGHPVVVLAPIADDIAIDEIPAAFARTTDLARPARALYPDCPTRIQLVDVHRRQDLIDAVPDASLVVVGRPQRNPVRLAWLRSSARAMQRCARTPIAVV